MNVFLPIYNYRDRYIEHLLHQIEQLTTELEYVRMESLRQSEALQHKLVEFEMRLSEKQLEVDEALQGKEDIEKKLSEAAQSAQEGSVVQLQLQVKRSKMWFFIGTRCLLTSLY